MRRYILAVAWVAAGLILFASLYLQNVYPLDMAIGYISRAQSAGYAEDASQYIRKALPLIPREGNPVWIFPTSRTDFTLINLDLRTILDRLSITAGLSRDSSAYSQALNDIRGRLAVIVNHIGEAMPYTMLSPNNLTIIILWALSLPSIHKLSAHFTLRKRRRPLQEQL